MADLVFEDLADTGGDGADVFLEVFQEFGLVKVADEGVFDGASVWCFACQDLLVVDVAGAVFESLDGVIEAPGVFGGSFDAAFGGIPFFRVYVDFDGCFDAFVVAGDAEIDGCAVCVGFVATDDGR